ncbi:hypothetical protein EVAR_31732_1 [Eumeta japonica]|uniref:Uncharacterized protein n=1 Tax=Eumeta variegata TaxID=151549 RepID=A0A4C1YQ78_EUMVA|nr:hypothetical protein EVAR_31732_1 [Eumeta japonica]
MSPFSALKPPLLAEHPRPSFPGSWARGTRNQGPYKGYCIEIALGNGLRVLGERIRKVCAYSYSCSEPRGHACLECELEQAGLTRPLRAKRKGSVMPARRPRSRRRTRIVPSSAQTTSLEPPPTHGTTVVCGGLLDPAPTPTLRSPLSKGRTKRQFAKWSRKLN